MLVVGARRAVILGRLCVIACALLGVLLHTSWIPWETLLHVRLNWTLRVPPLMVGVVEVVVVVPLVLGPPSMVGGGVKSVVECWQNLLPLPVQVTHVLDPAAKAPLVTVLLTALMEPSPLGSLRLPPTRQSVRISRIKVLTITMSTPTNRPPTPSDPNHPLP